MDGGRLEADRLTRVRTSPDLRFAVTVDNLGQVIKREVKVTLAIKQSPAPIVQTRTLARVDPGVVYRPTAILRNLGRQALATRTSVTIYIDDPGTFPVRYPVIFTRR